MSFSEHQTFDGGSWQFSSGLMVTHGSHSELDVTESAVALAQTSAVCPEIALQQELWVEYELRFKMMPRVAHTREAAETREGIQMQPGISALTHAASRSWKQRLRLKS